MNQAAAISVKGDRVECVINAAAVAGYNQAAVVTGFASLTTPKLRHRLDDDALSCQLPGLAGGRKIYEARRPRGSVRIHDIAAPPE